jgi:hypothetical protein
LVLCHASLSFAENFGSNEKPSQMAATWSSEITTQQNATAANETPGGRRWRGLQQLHQAHGGRMLEGYGGGDDDDDDGYEQRVHVYCFSQ